MESPEIKDYWSEEIENLVSWEPDDPEYIDIWFTVTIGEKGNEAADDFKVHLVTQKQLARIKDKKYLLVIPYYESWSKVTHKLELMVEECKDINWLGMSLQLEKLFLWEYHDYK